MIYGWDHPCTAERYEWFCAKHPRYTLANERLIAEAEIGPGQRVLDLAAGTGRTAELALAAGAEVTCWEPAGAMRRFGERRAPEARWLDEPPCGERFDRVVCGAAAWQWRPFSAFVRMAEAALETGGALVFNIPSLYLGIADEAGEGTDPLLLELASRLARGASPRAAPSDEPLLVAIVENELARAGLEARRWSFTAAISQECLCDWYRIPVLTDALLGEMDAPQRDARIDEAYREVDHASWKREGWTGWTAWKR